MSKYNVLITGVGAIIGYGVIKSLRKTDLDVCIIGMDICDDAVGQHWCDQFIQSIPASDIEYITFLKNIIKEHNINIVFFGTEQEIYRVYHERKELGEYYKKMVTNRGILLDIAQDKWKTREFLLVNHLEKYAIPSVIEGSYEEISKQYGNTFLLKPRNSYASKGIEKVSDHESFNFYKKRMGKQFMAQRLIGDNLHEYTVGIFGLGNGEYSSKIMMRRQLSQEGATAKAWIVTNKKLEAAVNELVKVFKPIGPTNLQFREDNDTFYLLEINPRISSSTSIRTAFGHNEALMCVEYFLNNNVIYPTVQSGSAVRYIDEVVVIDEC